MFVVRHIVILLCVVVTGTWGRRPFFGFGLPPMGPEKASSCPANNLEKLTIIGQNLLPLLGQAGDNWRNIMDPICDCGSHFLWPACFWYRVFKFWPVEKLYDFMAKRLKMDRELKIVDGSTTECWQEFLAQICPCSGGKLEIILRRDDFSEEMKPIKSAFSD
ncbi:hypothetical protein LSH36_237g01012 [Paralvinella palmiformis]|uniref:Uncharacterized protein n=1 Tax=Paralvinella palmiformis TaxID=53620 RepID=A0AAD9N3N0_9ANNE|nr:hypothetical protein LSH36_237g01012 [Paralvinella palmiformis]